MFKSLLALLILSGASMQTSYAADRPEQIYVEDRQLLSTRIEEKDDFVPILKADQEQTKIDNAIPIEDSRSMTQIITQSVQWVTQYLWGLWNDPFGFEDAFKDIRFM